MKPNHLIRLLLLALFLLSACTPKNKWATYSVSEFRPAENFLPYSFEYPSDWSIETGNNHISLVSNKKLRKDVPEKYKPGQITVGLSMNITMPPEEMMNTYADSLLSIIRFNDVVSIELNGHPAVYKEGTHLESNDQVFILAVDLGENMRGLMTARMAEGELEMQRDVLLTIAKSWHINP